MLYTVHKISYVSEEQFLEIFLRNQKFGQIFGLGKFNLAKINLIKYINFQKFRHYKLSDKTKKMMFCRDKLRIRLCPKVCRDETFGN